MKPAPRRVATAHAAYVLHRYDWSETSLIVDLFTRDLGRIAVAAKGAKRPHSQLRAVLMPFQRVSVSLGRNTPEAVEVHTLRGAEWAAHLAVLKGQGLFSGFYLNELLMKLLARQDAHPELFDAYSDTLTALAESDQAHTASAALRAFELRLMRETGVLPDLDCVTTTQQPVRLEQAYVIRPEGLGRATKSEAALPGEHCLALQSALDSKDPQALRQACVAALPALKPQLRSLLDYHLGSSLLRSRQVMRSVQRLLDLPVAGN